MKLDRLEIVFEHPVRILKNSSVLRLLGFEIDYFSDSDPICSSCFRSF